MPLISIFSFSYLLFISAYGQKQRNYYIEWGKEYPLEGFQLFYKKKPVVLKYYLDTEGKFNFPFNMDKIDCISYADVTHMSYFTKYKIMNFFCEYLRQRQLLSEKFMRSV